MLVINRWVMLPLLAVFVSLVSLNTVQAEKKELPPLHISDFSTMDWKPYYGKIVYVDFWASYCPGCRMSFPWMNEIQEKYKDRNFKIVSVNVDSTREAADAFLQQFPAKFDVIYDHEQKIMNEYGVYALPTSFLFDEKGYVITGHAGFGGDAGDRYEKSILKVLNSRKK